MPSLTGCFRVSALASNSVEGVIHHIQPVNLDGHCNTYADLMCVFVWLVVLDWRSLIPKATVQFNSLCSFDFIGLFRK